MQARAQFKRRSTANNVEILVPVPEDADSPRFRTNIGSVHYAPEKSAIIWKIKQFGGGKEFLMRAELGLPSVKGDDEHGGGMTGGFGGSMGGAGQGGKGKRPISVKFEIPYFTTSGIQVRYLKIIEPKVSGGDFLCPCPSSSLTRISVMRLHETYGRVLGSRVIPVSQVWAFSNDGLRGSSPELLVPERPWRIASRLGSERCDGPQILPRLSCIVSFDVVG